MKLFYRTSQLAVSSLSVIFLAGCINPTFNMPVQTPSSSELKYEAVEPVEHSLNITDARPEDAVFSEGRLNFNIQVDDADIDEVKFLSEAIINELKSRGMDVSQASNDSDSSNLNILTFKILNHRANGFSPLVTFTIFSGDLTVNGETQRIATFIKRGKVPIWSITEQGIVDNTFDQPISLLVQELASKIAQKLDNVQISDEEFEALLADIKSSQDDDSLRYLKVYQLGYGGNPRAIPEMVELLDDKDGYVRLAAISSLGVLEARGQVDRLISIFNESGLWQERGMALKALAEVDSDESQAVVDAEWQRISEMPQPDKEASWNKEIISLYR